MPITLGTNLHKEDNKINAKYDDLFKKLNVAKAWTNTQTTSSGGTAQLILGTDIIQSYTSDIDAISCGDYSNGGNSIFMAGGIIYKYYNSSVVQITTKNDFIKNTNGSSSTTQRDAVCYAIDSNHDLYCVTYYNGTTTLTQLGDGIYWSDVCYNGYLTAIGDGKLYSIGSSSYTLINGDTDWEKTLGTYLIKGGYAYYYNGSKVTLLDATVNNFIDVSGFYPYSYVGSGSFLTSDGYIYNTTYNYAGLYLLSSLPQNIIKMYNGCSPGSDICFITNKYKLYRCDGGDSSTPKQLTCNEIGNGIIWTDVVCGYGANNILAIGDGKLYLINYSSSSITLTQIGTGTNYMKLVGSTTGSYPSVAVAWTGDATSVTHTVYTTKNPQVNDNTYSDNNLAKYSVIQSTTGSTITDGVRTYDRDSTKDTYFNGIPQETTHESVSVLDMLRITNPNT